MHSLSVNTCLPRALLIATPEWNRSVEKYFVPPAPGNSFFNDVTPSCRYILDLSLYTCFLRRYKNRDVLVSFLVVLLSAGCTQLATVNCGIENSSTLLYRYKCTIGCDVYFCKVLAMGFLLLPVLCVHLQIVFLVHAFHWLDAAFRWVCMHSKIGRNDVSFACCIFCL